MYVWNNLSDLVCFTNLYVFNYLVIVLFNLFQNSITPKHYFYKLAIFKYFVVNLQNHILYDYFKLLAFMKLEINTLNKSDILFLLQRILVFAYLDFALNLIGLFINKIISKNEFIYIQLISSELLKPILIQTVVFALCLILAYLFFKKRFITYYAFTIVQTVVFHIIFIANIRWHNGLTFGCHLKNNGLQYLSNNGQYLTDLVSLFKPLNGNFDGGLFMPASAGLFYVEWILLVLIYFAVLTWITKVVSDFLFSKNTDNQTTTESEPAANAPDTNTRTVETECSNK